MAGRDGKALREALLSSAGQDSLLELDGVGDTGDDDNGDASSFSGCVRSWLEGAGEEIVLNKGKKGPVLRVWAIGLGTTSKGAAGKGGKGAKGAKGAKGHGKGASASSSSVLFVYEERICEKTSTCDQCRIIGWGTHPVSSTRYHFIIPAETGPDSLEDGASLVGVTAAARAGGGAHSSLPVRLPAKPSWSVETNQNANASSSSSSYSAQGTVYDSMKHRLHGVVHANGYGHLLRVNGVYGGSSRMTGLQMFVLWDALCARLGVRGVTVEDVSSKSGMELRVAYLVAYGCTWYGLLGYGFGRGPYHITEKRWHDAMAYVSGMTLSQLLYDFRGVEERVVGVVARYSRAVEGAVEVRDFGALMYRLMYLQLNPDQAVRFFGEGAGGEKTKKKKTVFSLKVGVKREARGSGSGSGTREEGRAGQRPVGGVGGGFSKAASRKRPTRSATAERVKNVSTRRAAAAAHVRYAEALDEEDEEEEEEEDEDVQMESPVFAFSTKRGTRSVTAKPLKAVAAPRTVDEYVKQSVDSTVDFLWKSAVCPSDDEDEPVVPRAWHGMEPGGDVEDPKDAQAVRNQITADLHLLFMCTLKMYLPDVAKVAGQNGAAELGHRHIAKIVKGKHISREVSVLRDTKHFVKTYRSTDAKQMIAEMGDAGTKSSIRVLASLVMPDELTSPDTSTRSGKKAMLPVQPPVEMIDMPANATVGDFLRVATERYSDTYVLCKRFKAIGAYVSVQKDDDNPTHPLIKKKPVEVEVFLDERTKLKTLPPMVKAAKAAKTPASAKGKHAKPQPVVLGLDVTGTFGNEVKVPWMLHAGGAQDWTVNCPCGTVDDDGAEMVACTKCDTWFHTRCVKPDASDSAWAKAYTCNRCLGIAILKAPRY